MQTNPVYLYIAPIPDSVEIGNIYPAIRNEEIENIANETKKQEKYCVWKLLEFAVKDAYNKNLEEIQFSKNSNGKWFCPEFYFSLSHSTSAVAVAISSKPVGVDIEMDREIKTSLKNKILSNNEMEEFENLADSNKNEWLIKKWTQKESAYKKEEIQDRNLKNANLDYAKTYTLSINNKRYFVSVCPSFYCDIIIKQDIKL